MADKKTGQSARDLDETIDEIFGITMQRPSGWVGGDIADNPPRHGATTEAAEAFVDLFK